MAQLWDDLEPGTTTRLRPKRRRKMTDTEQRVRWRMTLDELCYVAGITPLQFDLWTDEGILGGRHSPRPINGRGRHITRELAQRTVLVSRMVAAGVHPLVAGHIAQGHKTGDRTPLQAELAGGIVFSIDRTDLP